MKFVILIISIFITFLNANEKISALDIIRKSDNIRNASNSYYQMCNITQYINAKKKDSMLVSIYSKLQKDSGQYKTIVKILKPKRDKNKLILRNGDKLWFYDSNSKASIQISPQQRLLGQTSNGDVMSSNFYLDYDATLKKIQRIKGATKKEHDCYKLDLKAKNNNISYPFVEYWVDTTTFYPIRAKFYSANNKLLKDAYYRKFKLVIGKIRPSEVLIFDGFNKNKATKMSFAKVKKMEIPNFWFKRDFLKSFTGK